MLNLELIKGSSADFPLSWSNRDGSSPSGFTTSWTLTASVYAGDGQPSFLSPTCAWTTPPNYVLSFQDADTFLLDTGTYHVEVSATLSGRTARTFFLLTLLPHPGLGRTPSVYCTYSDMKDYAPFIGALQDQISDTEGFATQRHLARVKLEEVIQMHYRLQAGTGLTVFGNAVVNYGPRRVGSHNKVLQGYLDSNLLMLEPPRRVVEMTAKYAIAQVCQAQVTSGSPQAQFYQDMSSRYLYDWNNLVCGYHAEVDINGDGYPDYVIACGTTDALWA